MYYIELIEIKSQYEKTEQETIKSNIKKHMEANKTKYKDMRQLLKISEHTAYSYTNKANSNKPDLYNLLILAHYWNVSIYNLFK